MQTLSKPLNSGNRKMANPLLPPLLGTAFTSIAAPVVTFFLTRGSGQKAHLENLDSQTIATLSDRVSELEHSKYDLEIRNDKLAEDNSNLRQTNLELSATIREKSIQLSEATAKWNDISSKYEALQSQYRELFVLIQKLQHNN